MIGLSIDCNGIIVSFNYILTVFSFSPFLMILSASTVRSAYAVATLKASYSRYSQSEGSNTDKF